MSDSKPLPPLPPRSHSRILPSHITEILTRASNEDAWSALLPESPLKFVTSPIELESDLDTIRMKNEANGNIKRGGKSHDDPSMSPVSPLDIIMSHAQPLKSTTLSHKMVRFEPRSPVDTLPCMQSLEKLLDELSRDIPQPIEKSPVDSAYSSESNTTSSPRYSPTRVDGKRKHSTAPLPPPPSPIPPQLHNPFHFQCQPVLKRQEPQDKTLASISMQQQPGQPIFKGWVQLMHSTLGHHTLQSCFLVLSENRLFFFHSDKKQECYYEVAYITPTTRMTKDKAQCRIHLHYAERFSDLADGIVSAEDPFAEQLSIPKNYEFVLTSKGEFQTWSLCFSKALKKQQSGHVSDKRHQSESHVAESSSSSSLSNLIATLKAITSRKDTPPSKDKNDILGIASTTNRKIMKRSTSLKSVYRIN